MSSITRERDSLRAKLVEHKAVLDRIQNGSVKDEGNGNYTVSPEGRREFSAKLAEMKGIRNRLSELGEYEAISDYLNAPAGEPMLVGGHSSARGGLSGKSIGQAFVESVEFKNRQGNGIMQAAYQVGHDMVERKDIYTAAGGTVTRFAIGHSEREPIVQRPYRTDRVRDLFPVASTSANLIEYLRVLGYMDGNNNAAPVPEREGTGDAANFGLKPHTNLALQPAQAPVRTIAHYELAHRNTLDDEPQLRSIIDNELLYGLRLQEDVQLLSGDGTGENILGILETPGIQQYPGSATPSPVQPLDTYVDAVRRAATRVMLAYYNPTGIVVHPYDWETMELTKDNDGNYVVSLNVAVGAEKRLWQMPVVASPAMTQGTALVGAFGLGAKVYDREQSNIRVAEQHADLFVRNAVAILAEQRIALTVSRPEAFVQIDLPGSVPAEETPSP